MGSGTLTVVASQTKNEILCRRSCLRGLSLCCCYPSCLQWLCLPIRLWIHSCCSSCCCHLCCCPSYCCCSSCCWCLCCCPIQRCCPHHHQAQPRPRHFLQS